MNLEINILWNVQTNGVVFTPHHPQLFLRQDRLSGRNDVKIPLMWLDIKQNIFFEKNQVIKSLCGSLNKLELLYLNKYQTSW